MGGWMTYGRFRARNGLDWRPDEEASPYPSPKDPAIIIVRAGMNLVLRDLNRMERNYLVPDGEMTARCGPDPAQEAADATGVPVETVRVVLAYVFRDSR